MRREATTDIRTYPDHVTGGRSLSTPTGTYTMFIALTATGRPLEPTDEPTHQLDGRCWCQPTVEPDLFGMPYRYIHRRSLDAQHIERVEIQE